MRVGRTVKVDKDESNIFSIFLIICLVFGCGLSTYFLCLQRNETLRKNFAYKEIRDEIVGISDLNFDPYLKGRPFSFISDKIIPDEILQDKDFGLSFNQLRLKRITEYCQWEQHVKYHENEEKEEVKTFYYTKSWSSYLTSSINFDQAFAHFNPTDDPFPSFIKQTGAKLGAYHIDERITSKLNSFVPIEHIIIFPNYYEMNHNGFDYIGKGYFYSVYKESLDIRMIKLMGQYIEGTLFDYQISNLFSECEAGDIRFHYEVVNPKEVTVIATIQDNENLIPIIASNEQKILLIEPGSFSSNELLDRDIHFEYIDRVILTLMHITIYWMLIGILIQDLNRSLILSLCFEYLITSSIHFSFYGLNYFFRFSFYFGLIALYVVYRILDIFKPSK